MSRKLLQLFSDVLSSWTEMYRFMRQRVLTVTVGNASTPIVPERPGRLSILFYDVNQSLTVVVKPAPLTSNVDGVLLNANNNPFRMSYLQEPALVVAPWYGLSTVTGGAPVLVLEGYAESYETVLTEVHPQPGFGSYRVGGRLFTWSESGPEGAYHFGASYKPLHNLIRWPGRAGRRDQHLPRTGPGDH
jgi:hypothetical protein